MRRLTAPALLLALALGLTACGGGDTVDLAPVREAIDALDSAQADLRSRMSEIEQSLAVTGNAGEDSTAATGLVEQLSAIEEALAALRVDLTQAGMDQSTTNDELRSLLANLEATLNGVSASLTTIRNDLADVRDETTLLKQRFERHLQDHG